MEVVFERVLGEGGYTDVRKVRGGAPGFVTGCNAIATTA